MKWGKLVLDLILLAILVSFIVGGLSFCFRTGQESKEAALSEPAAPPVVKKAEAPPQPTMTELQEYCMMVEVYKETNGEAGWPDYNHNYASICPGVPEVW